MTCSLDYRNTYNNIRNKLLIVDLANPGLTDVDREFLVSRSGMMRNGLGLSESDSKTLSRILVKAFHSDLDPNKIDDNNTRDAIASLEKVKELIKSGEIARFEGKEICPTTPRDLATNWKKRVIDNISSSITSPSNDLAKQLNGLARYYIDLAEKATSPSRITNIYTDFSKKSIALLSDYKDKFFTENGINKKFDFQISADMSIEDLYSRLNKANNESKENTAEFIEKLISQYASTTEKQLEPLVSRIGKHYMDLLGNGDITVEQAKSLLNKNLEIIKKNEKLYIGRINRCKDLEAMIGDISSIKIRSRLKKISQSFYDDEFFEEEIASLEEDVRLIKQGKFGDKVLANVKNNYIQALSNSDNSLQSNMACTDTYQEFLHKIEEYNRGQIGVDSIYELNELFKDREQDKKIIDYVKGNYSDGDNVNLDLVTLRSNEYGLCGLVYRTDGGFFCGQRFYNYIGISGLTLMKTLGGDGERDITNLTEFICNSTMDRTQYFNQEEYFTVLCNYDDIYLIYDKDGKIGFKKKSIVEGIYSKSINQASENYSDIDWITECVSKDVAKDLSLAKILNGDYKKESKQEKNSNKIFY